MFKKKFFKVFLVNIIIIIFILITFEIFIKIFKLANLFGIDNNCIDSGEKYAFKKENECIVFGVKTYTDKKGYRIPEKTINYNNNNSIVFLGDSVTFGNGVIEEKTFVGRLRSKKKNFNVYNISLPGFQIEDHLENLKKVEEISNIESLFYVFSINDIQKKNVIKKNLPAIKNTTEKLRSLSFFNNLNTFLRDRSYSYIYFKGILTDPSKRWFEYDFNYFKNSNINDLKFFFEELIKIKNLKQFNLSVIILPYEYQTRKDKCNSYFLYPQLKLKEILNEINIDFLDLVDFFCKNKNPNDLYYKFDHMHLSDIGHENVYNFLIKTF